MRARHEARFQFVLGALIAIAIVGVLAAVLLLSAPAAGPDRAWSAWHPADGGSDGAQDIANHVAPEYRTDDGSQLVAVKGGPLEVAGLPVDIALESGQSIALLDGDSVMYTLCGLGKKCAIKGGTPSTERHLLLRREALELALYSFHYLGGVDQVVALLPPAPGKKPTQALMFRHDDLSPELDRPLRGTIAGATPTPESVDGSARAGMIDRLTLSTLYQFTFQPTQDAGAYLVLAPLKLS